MMWPIYLGTDHNNLPINNLQLFYSSKQSLHDLLLLLLLAMPTLHLLAFTINFLASNILHKQQQCDNIGKIT